MVVGEGLELVAHLLGEDGSRVACVGNPDVVVNHYQHDSTRTGLVPDSVNVLLHEDVLGLLEPVSQGLFWVLWEGRLVGDDVV